MDRRRLARGLGWFGLALGAAELAMPGRVTRVLGVRKRDGLVRRFGGREIAAGLGLLGALRPAPWLWPRVAGHALDLGLAAARRRSARPSASRAALAGAAAVTALDWAAARRSKAKR